MGDRSRTAAGRLRDDRATSPVVGKALEAAIVVLYVSLLATVLYGGIVPEYRAAAGEEVAERTLATTSSEIQLAIPPEGVDGEVVVEIDLPETIAGASYRIDATTEELVLEHPHPDVGTTVPLVLPERVEDVSGTLAGGDGRIRIVATEEGLEVELA